MIVEYIIMLNQQQDPEGRSIAMWDGYTPGDLLVEAYTGTISTLEQSDTDICDELFKIFNINHPADYHNRSLSVGDVVVLKIGSEVRYYAVERVGFKQVTL